MQLEAEISPRWVMCLARHLLQSSSCNREFNSNQPLALSQHAQAAIKNSYQICRQRQRPCRPRRDFTPADDSLSDASESKQRAPPYSLRPCASLRANLHHAIQAALPPNSLCGTPLRSDRRRQVSSRCNAVLWQRCPQPEPRAAGADTRVDTGGLQELGRSRLLVSPLVPTLPAGAAGGTGQQGPALCLLSCGRK